MSHVNRNNARQDDQAKARSTAVWDARFCQNHLWDYFMEIIPPDAIGADMNKHADHNSYSPKFWYQDERLACKDCGKVEVWTAEAQRWWFEVAKGLIYTCAIRCRSCRQSMAREERQGKPCGETGEEPVRGT
jgi:hypothetical protein